MNIEDLFKQSNIQFMRHGEHHHVTEGWINIDCPHCSPKMQKFRLGWNLRERYFNCWSCGPQQTINTVMVATNLPFRSVKELVKGIVPDDYFEVRKTSNKVIIPDSVGPLHHAHIRYLYGRRFDKIDDLIAKWKIQGIDHLGENLAWRIYIPIYFDNELVSWTTRTIGKKNPQRYLSAGLNECKFNLKHLLYGEDYVDGKVIIVTEGPINVWRIGPGSVATFGLEYTSKQVLKIAKYPIRYICMDANPDAQEVAEKLCSDLSVFEGETHNIELETGDDPASVNDKEVKQLQRLLK